MDQLKKIETIVYTCAWLGRAQRKKMMGLHYCQRSTTANITKLP